MVWFNVSFRPKGKHREKDENTGKIQGISSSSECGNSVFHNSHKMFGYFFFTFKIICCTVENYMFTITKQQKESLYQSMTD